MTALNWRKLRANDRMHRRGTESVAGARSAPAGGRRAVNPTPEPRRPKLAEPVIISEFWANRRGESVRIQLREFEGLALVDIRKHYTAADGTMQPTKKGLSIAIARLPDLAKAINQAVIKAIELGLIKGAEGGDG